MEEEKGGSTGTKLPSTGQLQMTTVEYMSETPRMDFESLKL